MTRWFKLVVLNEGNEEWMVEELKAGRLRFGWSPPGSNLIELGKLTNDQRGATILGGDSWKASAADIFGRGQFLLYRIQKGDGIVVQLRAPLRELLFFEVADGYSYSGQEGPDFNHILKGRLISGAAIPLLSKYLSNSLRHDFAKRGRYYQIYSAVSCKELDSIVENRVWEKADLGDESSQESELQKTEDEVVDSAVEIIRTRWQAKYFERFAAGLLAKIDGIEVKSDWDAHLGWDFTISIRDILTGDLLHDDVPVQCKNYQGEVVSTKPIEDLERCIKNSPAYVDIVYLFIIGKPTEGFDKAIETFETRMKAEYRRNISIRVVDERQIARLYLKA